MFFHSCRVYPRKHCPLRQHAGLPLVAEKIGSVHDRRPAVVQRRGAQGARGPFPEWHGEAVAPRDGLVWEAWAARMRGRGTGGEDGGLLALTSSEWPSGWRRSVVM